MKGESWEAVGQKPGPGEPAERPGGSRDEEKARRHREPKPGEEDRKAVEASWGQETEGNWRDGWRSKSGAEGRKAAEAGRGQEAVGD